MKERRKRGRPRVSDTLAIVVVVVSLLLFLAYVILIQTRLVNIHTLIVVRGAELLSFCAAGGRYKADFAQGTVTVISHQSSATSI